MKNGFGRSREGASVNHLRILGRWNAAAPGVIDLVAVEFETPAVCT
jgi:hypothetical protein